MNINMQELVVHQYTAKPKTRVPVLPFAVLTVGIMIVVQITFPF